MRKEIFLIKGDVNESYQNFSDRIVKLATTISQNQEIEKTKISYTNVPPPRWSVIPFKKEKIAVISVYTTKDGRINFQNNIDDISGVYLAEEAIPVKYKKTWNDLQATPGVCLLTLFRKKKGIDYPTFIDRWHNGHTPLSLKIHPLWNYNRNVVKQDLLGTSEAWDGIVEEQVRSSSELINPLKFFGNPFIMPFNMIRVYFDTISFLEYKTIEPYFATELHIKS